MGFTGCLGVVHKLRTVTIFLFPRVGSVFRVKIRIQTYDATLDLRIEFILCHLGASSDRSLDGRLPPSCRCFMYLYEGGAAAFSRVDAMCRKSPVVKYCDERHGLGCPVWGSRRTSCSLKARGDMLYIDDLVQINLTLSSGFPQ